MNDTYNASDLWGDRYVRDENDLVFDNAAGTKTTVTSGASVTLITPPAGCRGVQIDTDQGIYLNTENATAADDGTSMYLPGGTIIVMPVMGGVAVNALAAGANAEVRCMPMVPRSL